MKLKSIEDEINSFLESWDLAQMSAFIRDTMPLMELYDVNEDDDWVEKIAGEETNTIRLIRTVYLVSRIAEFHAGKLCLINANFKNLWKKMEKEALKINNV